MRCRSKTCSSCRTILIFLYIEVSGGTMASGVDTAPNRDEYQEYFLGCKGGRCVGLTTLPPSFADCLEIWEPQPLGTLRACPGLCRYCLTLLSLKRPSDVLLFSGPTPRICKTANFETAKSEGWVCCTLLLFCLTGSGVHVLQKRVWLHGGNLQISRRKKKPKRIILNRITLIGTMFM
jgi:hypothetical protein